MVELYDYGADLHSSFTFKDGDIQLSSYKDNIVQAIINRFTTDLNELDLFYKEYGSVLTGFCGWRRTDETLAYIKLEVDNTLKQDPRIQIFKSEVFYDDAGVVNIELTLYPAFLTVNFILTNDGIELKENEEV